MTKSWKQTERRAAKVFKSRRTPLSGGNSGHTRSDSLSPYFFLESKSSKKNAQWTLYLKTRPLARKEGKAPALITHLDNHPGFLITIHSDDLQAFIQACIDSGVYDPSGAPPEVAELPAVPPAPEPQPSSNLPGGKPLRRTLGRGSAWSE